MLPLFSIFYTVNFSLPCHVQMRLHKVWKQAMPTESELEIKTYSKRTAKHKKGPCTMFLSLWQFAINVIFYIFNMITELHNSQPKVNSLFKFN